ncbi:uncharacterized protein J7T54_008249 [Emericellopsis cladophorae]|uniref:Major facilitator superfamily (MFS) profile domain-containing protein n=1 Tax=Emericellopsis cladophorae TaxID=2686198 RepID=A0A9Q0BCE0_9HYPO|nr:uncharacterized protein J7T54_008249 [Emericellopsis cladophorae]KAI6779631.1 hypothetical protein J7T54_008249 [Emericellopsis cladophorae]
MGERDTAASREASAGDVVPGASVDCPGDASEKKPLSGDRIQMQEEIPTDNGLGRYDTIWRRLLTPPDCRWNKISPPAFTTGLCVLYALSATFTVANLYYNQPILDKIAVTFDVTYEQSSQVPTLLQAGYAAGLIFILPLGDMVERRAFILALVLLTATLWISLCVTTSFTTFRIISFICGATTVTPQLMIPLVGDFAPPERKGANLSIVTSGLLLGMLVARLLSGVVANYTAWRNIYWLACGAQYVLGLMLYLFMPDYPATNPDTLHYLRALWSIPKMMFTEPVLIQACAMAFTMSSCFTSFWTTVTFLLVSPPYEYPSLVVGLFSLLNIVALVSVPLYGRIIDRFVPLFSILLGQMVMLGGIIFGTFTGTFTVAGPILQAIGIDVGVQIAQVANRSSIFSINPKARNRVNTAYMACAFAGQLTGTAVGNRLYAAGGWRYSGGCSSKVPMIQC